MLLYVDLLFEDLCALWMPRSRRTGRVLGVSELSKGMFFIPHQKIGVSAFFGRLQLVMGLLVRASKAKSKLST